MTTQVDATKQADRAGKAESKEATLERQLRDWANWGPIWLVRKLVVEYLRQGVGGMAAQASFRLTIALPSLLLVLMTLAGLADRYTSAPVASSLRDIIEERAPEDLKPLFESLLDQATSQSGQRLSINLAVALVIAFWGTSGSIAVVVSGCNRVYGVRDRRSWVTHRLLVLGVTFGAAVVVVLTVALAFFSERAGRQIVVAFGLERSSAQLWSDIAQWVQIGLIMLALTVLYWIGPDVEKSKRWILPGIFAATAGWLITLTGFSRILNLSNPATPYGGAASVVALLLLLYWTVLVILCGALLNAVLGKRYDRRLKDHLRQRPLRYMERPKIPELPPPLEISNEPEPPPARLAGRWWGFAIGAAFGTVLALVIRLIGRGPRGD